MRCLKTKTAVILLVSFLGIISLGCSAPPPKMEDVKGKWVAIEKENYQLGGGKRVGFAIEIFDDNSVMLPSGKGTWTILKDGRLKIEILGMTMYGSLQEGKLTITMPENKGKVIFKKQ